MELMLLTIAIAFLAAGLSEIYAHKRSDKKFKKQIDKILEKKK